LNTSALFWQRKRRATVLFFTVQVIAKDGTPCRWDEQWTVLDEDVSSFSLAHRGHQPYQLREKILQVFHSYPVFLVLKTRSAGKKSAI